MATLPDWMVPPRPEGWFAEDLDHLPEAPRHTELWDGALIFMMSPQRAWHRRVVSALETELRRAAASSGRGFDAIGEMSLRLDRRNRPEPDLLVITAPADGDRTFFDADEVVLVVEVVSPESEDRDRHVKPERYARAGIANLWRVEEEDGDPVVYVYELDPATTSYAPAGVFRGELHLTRPFPIDITLTGLAR